jgi:hypothetical protein
MNTDPTTREAVSAGTGQQDRTRLWENPSTKQLIGYQIVKLV